MSSVKYVLKSDVRSNFHKGNEPKLYGKWGDVVTLVSDEHGEVLIVEDKKGTRFPVQLNKVEKIGS